MVDNVVIVGAGQAALSAAMKLRGEGFEGKVQIIGDEAYVPYQRPPLSKKYVVGDIDIERLYLKPESYYDEANIELILNTSVTAIDRDAKTVTADGATYAYDKLILATGTTPRQLPKSIIGDWEGIYTLRGLDDAESLRAEFVEGRHLVVVGGGYIGLEAAAAARLHGLEVTVLEAAPRLLQRVAAEETSRFVHDYHKTRGVNIIVGANLSAFDGENGRVNKAILNDNTALKCDFAIVGIGVVPNTQIAEAAGLICDNGIVVDEFGRTKDPNIYAIGDCAQFPHKGTNLRLESVPHAIDQADNVALNIMGKATTYVAKPWFWSDQYDLKLQIAGLNIGYDNVVVRETETGTSHWYYHGDELLAVDAMNDSRAYMVGKRLIEAGKTADKANIADPAFELKTLLKG